MTASVGMRPGAHAAIIRGRRAMVGIHSDRCEVTRDAVPGDTGYVAPELRVPDPVTFQVPPQGRVVVYKGPCRVQVKADINSNVVAVVSGERDASYLTAQLQTPVEVEELAMFPDHGTFDGTGFIGAPGLIDVNYVARIMSAPYDSALEGRLFGIKGPFHKSQGVYRRFRLNEAV